MKAQRRPSRGGGHIKNSVSCMGSGARQAAPIKNAVAAKPKAQGPAKIKGAVS